jgi:hypothetical protein
MSNQVDTFYPRDVYRITRMKRGSSGGTLILRDMRDVQNVQVRIRTQRKPAAPKNGRPVFSRPSNKRIKGWIVFSGYEYTI